MKGPGSYVPPPYIPLNQEDTDAHNTQANGVPYHQSTVQDPTQWSSGICACFDDMQSCMPLSDLWSLFTKNIKFKVHFFHVIEKDNIHITPQNCL